MAALLCRLWKEEDGQDLTEYILLLVLLALVGISAMKGLATAIGSTFSSTASNLASMN